MKCVLTGGAGFIGSNMAKLLLKKQTEKIIIIDNFSTGSRENLAEIEKDSSVQLLDMDVTNPEIVDFLKAEKVDEIYNFACPASPKYYMKYPVETWMASVYGIKNLLDVVRDSDVTFFQSSTSEIYGAAVQYPQAENYWGNVNPIGVRSCYDEGKRAAESLIYDYVRQYDVDVRVARIFNTFGPGMTVSDGRVISNLICQALKGEDMTIYGTGDQTRSFCFVEDTIRGIDALMHAKERPSMPVNIGNPYELSINEVALYVKEAVESHSKIVHLEPMQDEILKRKPDITYAKQMLDWGPIVPFSEGIRQTIEYYRARV